MEKKMPKVSVLMPCYNHEKYVATAIESVLNQTYTDFELIVADNGCTDGSYEVIKDYEERITILRLEKNDVILCGNMLRDAAKGQYIAYMTSDDYWMPDKLEKQISILEQQPDVGVCTTWAYTADENLNYDTLQKNIFMFPNCGRVKLLRHFLEVGNCLAYPSSIMRREFLFEHKKPERGYRQLDDLFLWIHVLFEKDIYIVEEPLMVFRWHTLGDNRNMSAPTQENSIRTWNEMADIIGYVLDNIADELFVEIFKDHLLCDEPESSIEILCEKFLWLNDKAKEQPFYESQLLNFYFRHCSKEFQQTLENKYGFSLNDFWTISGTNGIPFYYTKLENEMRQSRISYRKGVETAISKLCGSNLHDYQKQLFCLLPEETQNYISVLNQLIGKFLQITEKCDDLTSPNVYDTIIIALKQMVMYVDNLRDDLSFLGIDMKEDEWERYSSLVEFGETKTIDLFEFVIPYTKRLYKEMMKIFF